MKGPSIYRKHIHTHTHTLAWHVFLKAQTDVAVSPETHKELHLHAFSVRFVEAAVCGLTEAFLESDAAMGSVVLQSCSGVSAAQPDTIALLIRSQPGPGQCKVRGVRMLLFCLLFCACVRVCVCVYISA